MVYNFLTKFVVDLLSGALPLFGSNLSSEQINGNLNISSWQNLPEFLPGGSLKYGYPWGNLRYQPGENDVLPDTNVTRYYNLTVSEAKLSPDGYQKDMLLFNGQFPGPLIEANWGDWVEITVTNTLTEREEGTAIHWHGLRQYQTQFADGVPGLVQCPIAPGSSYTYRFRADHVGSSWYHSHYSAQLSSGLIGPMIFYGPRSQHYDIDLGPVLVHDYFHPYYQNLLEHLLGNFTGSHFTFSDNNLINGRMDYNCDLVTDGSPCVSNAGVSKFKFTPGKDHLLRVVNPGAAGLQFFTIDEHEFTVIANDFIPIEPYKTNSLTLGVGQRNDIIVRGKTGHDSQRAYWMRTNLSVNCALPHQPYGLAAIYYDEADFAANKTPSSIPQPLIDDQMPCINAPLNVTRDLSRSPAPPADFEVTIHIKDTVNSTNHPVWLLNNQTTRINYNDPILGLASEGNFSYPNDPEWNVVDTRNSSVVRLVWENTKFNHSDPNFFNLTFAHPMHLHGHDYQVLSYGDGAWDGTIINGDGPIRRDTVILPPNGHVVMQFTTDNPGVWPVHCHVAWHVSAGLLMNVMEQPEKIDGQENIQSTLDETCKAWNEWSTRNVVAQIDSGLRMALERE